MRDHRKRQLRRRRESVAASLAAALVLAAAPAQAAFPGANGKIVYVCTKGAYVQGQDPREICTVTQGTAPKRLSKNHAADLDPAFSADGTTIAFDRAAGCAVPAQCSDLYRMRADGSGLKRLTNTPAGEIEPTWSPDGKKLAYVKGLFSEHPKIVVMRASDGQVLHTLGEGVEPSWSPNGKRIAFAREDHLWCDPSTGGSYCVGSYGIYSMGAANGSGVARLTRTTRYANGAQCPEYPPEGCPETNGSPSWRPDGKAIAWDIFDSKLQIGYVDSMSAAGGNGTRMASKPGCPQDPSWSPDGKRLVFSDGTYCDKGGNPPSIYVKSGAGIARLTAGSSPDWGPKP